MAKASHDDELEKLRRHVRILVDIGRIAGEKSDLNRFLDEIVVQVARAVEIDHVKVLQYRQKHGDLIVAAGVGWKHGAVRSATLSADLRSPPGRSFRTAEPVTIADFGNQDDYILSDLLKEHGIISLANTPVLIDGAAWGVLEVDSTTLRDFSQDTTEFLTAVAAVIGIVVRNLTAEPTEILRLAAAAAEAQNRDIRLRELQHRVKNNFQLILGSIALQKRRYSAPEVQQALAHVASRITAISLAHDQLAPRHDGQVVTLSDYLRVLCLSIRQQTEGVEIDVEADNLELAIDRAVPIGLILNELITNSIKHAFSETGGRTGVRLAAGVGYGEGRLTVADDGRGFKTAREGGSGLKLIQSLARQIGGSVAQESSDKGTVTSLTFPVIT